MLAELQALPPQEYSEEESQMLQHMLVILRYATAELLLVFAERGVVDFVELGLAARRVLRDDEGQLSELAADVAARWPHLLVDEFQDTSRSQYELLTLIASGWESAGRGTCFLVGDPMQSIYMFRQAEVELFERTRRYGLGEGTAVVQLTPLTVANQFSFPCRTRRSPERNLRSGLWTRHKGGIPGNLRPIQGSRPGAARQPGR